MNNGQKIIAALLTVACALLLVNVINVQPNTAMASAPAGPTVVGGDVVRVNDPGEDGHRPIKVHVYRIWSDGGVDSSLISFSNDCRATNLCTREIIAP